MMSLKIILFLILIFISTAISAFPQTEDWRKLVALESTRVEVEKKFGQPEKYFDTYGTYETDAGRFSAWYSKGGCHKDEVGLQYDVSAQIVTGVYFRPYKGFPLDYYISDLWRYTKTDFLMSEDSYNYTSPNDSVVYQTIMRNDSTEFVNSISIQPSNDKKHLLCKNNGK